MASGSSSPWLYKAAAVAATVTLTASAGYVIFKYVLTPEPDSGSEPEPVSMQSLLTGGAASAPKKEPTRTGVVVRKTPTPTRVRGGPSLPARKSAANKSTKPTVSDDDGASTSLSEPPPSTTPSDPAPTSTEPPPSSSSSSSPTSTAPKPITPNLKSCAHCSAPLKTGGLPLRCGACKAVYYCSTTCQKKHWPEHKPACSKTTTTTGPTTTGSGGSPAKDAPTSPTTDNSAAGATDSPEEIQPTSADITTTNGDAPSTPADTAGSVPETGASTTSVADAVSDSNGGPASASASASAPGPSSGGLQGALVEVLRQAAEKGAGTLDGRFEEAVLKFLGGEHAAALSCFQSLQTAARTQSRPELALEVHKWLGHTHTKLGNFTAAAEAFQAGIDEAKASGATASYIDNAVGLGNLWKMVGKLTQAGHVLKEALKIAQEADNAGMQSEVLVALAAVIMSVDAEEGLTCLQIAVQLRQDEVAKAAESGDRAAMATGMMQAASALVNMAAALFATRRFEQARLAYEQALEIFDLMEDSDKVIQVLVNLANLAELQLGQPGLALEFREKLAAVCEQVGQPGIGGGAAVVPCGLCHKPISIKTAHPKGDLAAAMVILGCMHVHHDACFKEACDQAHEENARVAAAAAAGGDEATAAVAAAAASAGAKRTAVCPTCQAPVPVMF